MGTVVTWLIIIVVGGCGGYFLWRTSRSTGSDTLSLPGEGMPSWLKDMSWARRAAGWSARNGATAGRNGAGWVRRLVAWWKSRGDGPGNPGAPLAPSGGPLPAPRQRRPRGPEARAAAILHEAIGASPAMQPGPVPADWLALASRVADAEFEDDAAFIAHFRGEGAGLNAYAEAVFARGETLLSTHGLDPSIVRANMAHADQVGECAAGSSATIRQLLVVYGEIKQRIAAGDFRLPKNADTFLTGEGV